MSAPLTTRSSREAAQRSTPQSGLAERQGLCHISQLLEMLFMKYGIDADGDDAAVASEFSAPVELPVASSVVTSPTNSQSTFGWFQPNELTV